MFRPPISSVTEDLNAIPPLRLAVIIACNIKKKSDVWIEPTKKCVCRPYLRKRTVVNYKQCVVCQKGLNGSNGVILRVIRVLSVVKINPNFLRSQKLCAKNLEAVPFDKI